MASFNTIVRQVTEMFQRKKKQLQLIVDSPGAGERSLRDMREKHFVFFVKYQLSGFAFQQNLGETVNMLVPFLKDLENNHQRSPSATTNDETRGSDQRGVRWGIALAGRSIH